MKAFVSRRIDRYRPSYMRYVIEQPRCCVFVGTTNAHVYLKDETGGRRYLPVRCGVIDVDAIRRDRDQLWAEAVHQYKKGVKWWLTDAAVVTAAREEQAARYQPDAWQDVITDFVVSKTVTSIPEVLEKALDIEDKSRWDRVAQLRVATCLTNMEWTRKRDGTTDETGKRPWKYHRPQKNGTK